jgi:aspartyl/asparaginyl beta-hydroxylase (cupin superfamily)
VRLEEEMSYNKQDRAVVDSVRREVHLSNFMPTSTYFKVVKNFPKMEHFRNHWPVTDIMQSRLKTSSRKAKKGAEAQAKDVEKDVGPTRNVGPSRKVNAPISLIKSS